MILKLLVVIICGCVQLYLVKQILEDNFSPLPGEEVKEES